MISATAQRRKDDYKRRGEKKRETETQKERRRVRVCVPTTPDMSNGDGLREEKKQERKTGTRQEKMKERVQSGIERSNCARSFSKHTRSPLHHRCKRIREEEKEDRKTDKRKPTSAVLVTQTKKMPPQSSRVRQEESDWWSVHLHPQQHRDEKKRGP